MKNFKFKIGNLFTNMKGKESSLTLELTSIVMPTNCDLNFQKNE